MDPRLTIAVIGLLMAPALPRADTGELASQRTSDTVVVTRPTIIAAFPVTQAQVDSGGDLNEALSDFQYYLPSVRRGLQKFGGVLVERYDSLIPIRERGSRQTWDVMADGGAGYLFLAPGRPSRRIRGVMTDTDLLDEFTKWMRSHRRRPGKQ